MCGDYADILYVQVATLLSLRQTLQQYLYCYKQHQSDVWSCICLVFSIDFKRVHVEQARLLRNMVSI